MPRGWLGVTIDGPLTDSGDAYAGEWDLMAASGVETVRVAFDWRRSQAADGAISLRRQRRGGRHRGGASAAGAAGRAPDTGLGVRRRPPARRRTTPRPTRRFLTALVQRYGPNGSLWAERPTLPRMPIRHWQIWNEPEPDAVLDSAAVRQALRRAAEGGAAGGAGRRTRARRSSSPGCRTISWVALREIYQAGGARQLRRRGAPPLHELAAQHHAAGAARADGDAPLPRRPRADLADRALVGRRARQGRAACPGW